MSDSVVYEYWQKFLEATGRSPETVCSGDLDFESKGFGNAGKIALALSGKKTGFFSSLATFTIDGEPLPVSGELYILFDQTHTPCAVLQIDSVSIVPFNEVTWEMASQEGEDASLEEWKQKMQEYLEEEGEVVGFKFVPDIRLVFQTFTVLYR